MALDADTVLWALRGLPFQDEGVSADELARFLAQDATLSEDYSRDDVKGVLESLVAAGDLALARATDAGVCDGNGSTDATMLYRLPAWPDSLMVRGDRSVGIRTDDDEWDGSRRNVRAHEMHDLLTAALTEQVTAEGDAATHAAHEIATDAMRGRVEELERERDALVTDRAAWRERAESAELEAMGARSESDALRARVRDLERRLELERALDVERTEATRRTAAALARARHELDRLEQSVAGGRAQPQAARRPALRGNWLQ